MDLNDPRSIDRAVNTLAARGFRVDALVNNAGVLYESPLLELTDKQIEDSIATHRTDPAHPGTGSGDDQARVRKNCKGFI